MTNQHSSSRLYWDADMDTGDKNKLSLEQLIFACCEDVDSSFSTKVGMLWRYKDYDALLNLTVDPLSYRTPMAYLDDIQVLALIKKNPFLPHLVNTKLAGMKGFLKSERGCAATNYQYCNGGPMWSPAIAPVLHEAKRKIAILLGDCPPIHELPLRFGPGAALNVNKYTSAYHKLKSTLDVTIEAFPAALNLLESCPGWAHAIGISPYDESGLIDQLHVVSGSRLSFVPKTAKTDRPICIEPLLNGAMQKGYGTVIRNRLKRHNWVDLRKAQPLHRSLAQQASIDGSLSTIDLSAASDSISTMFVMDMLPPAWFNMLDDLRSKNYCVDGIDYEFEKFSSMGNGYTFELESLLFLAIAKSVMDSMQLKGTVSCYGDDIIIPTACSDLLIKVLKAVGFDTNVEKSFIAGPFRESCGGDFFKGTDVRPFYLKTYISPRSLTLLVNYIARRDYKYKYPKLYKTAVSLLKRSGNLRWGPDNGTDGHLIVNDFPYGVRFQTIENHFPAKSNHSARFFKAFLLYRQTLDGHLDEVINFKFPVEVYKGYTPYGATKYVLRARIIN